MKTANPSSFGRRPQWLLLAPMLLLTAFQCFAQQSDFRDEISGQSISDDARNIIVLIHGWNPEETDDKYTTSDELYLLVSLLKLKLQGSNWKVVAYHWESAAATGPVMQFVTDLLGYANATDAAFNAQQEGARIASLLTNRAPELRQVHFIAHSAGSWAAREAMRLVLQKPYVVAQMTLLDPFIPDASLGIMAGLSNGLMSATINLPGNERIRRLENYYAEDIISQGTVFGTLSTQEEFTWRGADINLKIDWGFTLTPGLHFYYDYHSGPILFYADTVAANIVGGTVPTGLYGLNCPFIFDQVGWYQSLAWREIYLPKITAQPQEQAVQDGGTATFSVSANRATSFQWFKDGVLLSGTLPSLSVSAVSGNAGEYVVRVGNANGHLFSEKARLTVIPATTAPVIVTPPQNRTVTENQTAMFTVLASGTPPLTYQWQRNGSDLLGANGQTYTTAPLLRANNGDQFRVRVSNGQGSAISSAATLTVNSAPPPANADAFEPNNSSATATSLALNSGVSALISTPTDTDWFRFSIGQQGTLTLALSVPSANDYDLELYGPSGVFLQGSYGDAGQTESITFSVVTTGTHYVRVYGFPEGNGSYNAATPYTLAGVFTPAGNPPPNYTLSVAAVNGSVSRSPDLAGYSSNSLVTLTASANPGYQFTGWSGSASGNGNPIVVTMNANKSITGNFAPLPAGAGSIRVSIIPQAAADAGARWKLTNEATWHMGGEIVSVPSLGTYEAQFDYVSGWATPPNKTVTLFPAQTDIWINSDLYVQQPVLPIFEFFYNIAFADNKFVAVDDRTSVILTPDGVNWSRQSLPLGFSIRAFVYDLSLYVIVGVSNGAAQVMTSSTGSNWTSRVVGSVAGSLNAVTFGQNKFVAVGTKVATSANGINWVDRTVSTCGSGVMRGIAYGNGVFVASTEFGTVLTSSDAITWLCQPPLTPAESLAALAFGNNMFVMVGYNGRIFTSPNGVNWTARVSNSPEYLAGISFGNNTFVAVGDNGRVVSSPDGVNWTRRSAGTTKNLRGVAYGNGMFVAAGFNGALVPLGNAFGSLITSQPSSATRTEGENVIFTVFASGAGPFQYQWYRQGGTITGETNSTLTVENLSTNDAGIYTVEVSSSSAAQISQGAILTVNTRPMRPVLAGTLLPANAGFELTISGEAGRNYRIQQSTNLANWTDLTTVYSTNANTIYRHAPSNALQTFYRVVTP